MFAEGESELRELVVKNLESCGFLSKIKAELRAGVFLALSDEGSLRKKVPLSNKKLDDFVNTSEGKLALSIVREFLEHFNLNFTLSVFDPEVSHSNPYVKRKDLCKDLNLNESDCDLPVLSVLLKNLGAIKPCDSFPKKYQEEVKLAETFKDKTSISDSFKEKDTVNIFSRNPEGCKETSRNENIKSNESNPVSSLNKTGSNRSIFDFSKPEQKDIFKDQSSILDSFFDDPVPTEKPNFLNLDSANDLNEQKKISSSEKGSLSSLRDLPSLNKQDNSRKRQTSSVLVPDIIPSDSGSLNTFKEDLAIKDVDPESNEEFSDKQLNSEDSIEEEIEEEFSAGLDDILNSSLSLGDDATSEQTVSQSSVVDGVDHIEPVNSVL